MVLKKGKTTAGQLFLIHHDDLEVNIQGLEIRDGYLNNLNSASSVEYTVW